MKTLKETIMFLEAEKKLAEEMEIKHLVVVYKNYENAICVLSSMER